MDSHNESEWLSQMIAHHREAIVAARELARSDRAEMRRLGADIVATQTVEVDEMSHWLAAWYPSSASQDPGYQPEMRDLRSLTGDALDRAFLRDMIGHHMVAVMMSQRLLTTGLARHDEVAELARTIARDQHAEMVTMRDWFRQWFGRTDSWMMAPGWLARP